MHVDQDDGMSSCEDKPVISESGQRRPWHRPAVVMLHTYDAETGVNSTTDINATFS